MYEIFEQLLKENHVTPYRVAKETGIATATLTQWKNGTSIPKKDKLQKIASYFGVSLDYLVGNKIPDENEYEAKNKSEREMLLLCRKANDIPEEDREKIVDMFKNTIDIYLNANEIKKGDK